MKTELIVNAENEEILSVFVSNGVKNDAKILLERNVKIEAEIEILADKGYQGLHKKYPKAHTPFKKTKLKELTKEQKNENTLHSRQRIKIEHINRKCKHFRIVKDTYRGKKKDTQTIWNIIAGLVNLKNQKKQ